MSKMAILLALLLLTRVSSAQSVSGTAIYSAPVATAPTGGQTAPTVKPAAAPPVTLPSVAEQPPPEPASAVTPAKISVPAAVKTVVPPPLQKPDPKSGKGKPAKAPVPAKHDKKGGGSVSGKDLLTGGGESTPETSKGKFNDAPVIVPAEVTTPVDMSSSDVNRVSCATDIKDVIYSKEKGVQVKYSGRDAYIKFLIKRVDDKELYATTPSELFVICQDATYPLIAVPKRIPAQTVRLATSKSENVKKNQTIVGELPYEKKVLSIIKAVYTNDIPDSYTVTKQDREIHLFKDIRLILRRTVSVEGEGITLKEFSVELAKGATQLELEEKDFLRKEITSQAVGISIDKLVLKPGVVGRLFIAERNSDDDAFGRSGKDSRLGRYQD